jgi:predicted AlkP superfamily phosphohydrolase/phosphomutase
MKQSTIVVGLDAAEPRLIEKWMAEGHLPNLSKIRQAGTYSRLDNTVKYLRNTQLQNLCGQAFLLDVALIL